MSKLLLPLVVLALLGTARCYNADLEASLGTMPIVGPMIAPSPPTPAYVASIGAAAPTNLPESDPRTWFPADTTADPMDPATWTAIRDFLSNTGTQAGWTAACKKVSEAANSDRAGSPLGGLACSADASVTALQPFATAILAARAEVALWLKGAPGASTGAIQARQGELRLLCAPENLRRLGGETSAFGQACTKALDTTYLTGDGAATFAALGEAYTLVAAELATRDPKIAQEPAFFGTTPTSK